MRVILPLANSTHTGFAALVCVAEFPRIHCPALRLGVKKLIWDWCFRRSLWMLWGNRRDIGSLSSSAAYIRGKVSRTHVDWRTSV